MPGRPTRKAAAKATEALQEHTGTKKVPTGGEKRKGSMSDVELANKREKVDDTEESTTDAVDEESAKPRKSVPSKPPAPTATSEAEENEKQLTPDTRPDDAGYQPTGADKETAEKGDIVEKDTEAEGKHQRGQSAKTGKGRGKPTTANPKADKADSEKPEESEEPENLEALDDNYEESEEPAETGDVEEAEDEEPEFAANEPVEANVFLGDEEFKPATPVEDTAQKGSIEDDVVEEAKSHPRPNMEEFDVAENEGEDEEDVNVQAPKATGEPQVKEEIKEEPQEEVINETAGETHHQEQPSNVLERGIIYFLFRGRVGIDRPTDLNEVARSFLVLRPLPADTAAQLQPPQYTEEGGTYPRALPVPDPQTRNCRLILLPKKRLPSTSAHPHDRYMAFVEKARAPVTDVQAWLAGQDYETKTRGPRHVPAATPAAEGVYAVVRTDPRGTTHLVYVLTLPRPQQQGTQQGQQRPEATGGTDADFRVKDEGEDWYEDKNKDKSGLLADLGLAERGSYIISVRNPKYPVRAPLPTVPEYPERILESFGHLRWAPVTPEVLDYPSTQLLLIGEAQGFFGGGGVSKPEEEGAGGMMAGDEIEELETENEVREARQGGLKEDEAIFRDLGLSRDIYPSVSSTWVD